METSIVPAPADLLATLEETFGSPGYVPPMLPSVALRAHEIARAREPEVAPLVELVESDPMLAAAAMRIARSAAVSGRVPVESVTQAVVRLGVHVVRDLVWQAALQAKIFRASGFERTMESLRWHSVACAHLSRLVARRAGAPAEVVALAFLAGLVHDAGLAAALIEISGRHRGRVPAVENEVGDALYRIHGGAGVVLAGVWGLPPEIARVMSDHHRVPRGGEPQENLLLASVMVGHGLAAVAGAGVVRDDGAPFPESPPTVGAWAAETLGFTDETLDELRLAALGLLPTLA